MPAWSYTALTAYETCPRRFFHTRVAKDFPDPPGAEADWGNRVHKVLEDRLNSGIPLTGAMSMFEPVAAKFTGLAGTLRTEHKVALNEQFKPTTWFGKDVWCRGVFDVEVEHGESMLIADWKTGKRKPDSDQLKLFAALGFAIAPQVERIKTAFVWLKVSALDSAAYTRADLAGIWRVFLPRVDRLMNAHATGKFPPKPSGLCRKWCPVSSCEHYQK